MQTRLRFSLRGLLLLILFIAATHTVWVDWYEVLVLRSTFVPTNYNRFNKVSPFTSVSTESGRVDVTVNGKAYELLAINGVKVDRLLRIAALAFDQERAVKRFVEDLPAVLNAAGMDGMKTTVRLDLLDPQSGQILSMPRVPMTRENRSLVYGSR